MEEFSDGDLWDSFKRFSKTFSTATRLLPREVRVPVATLYAFCRRVDDLADTAITEVERRDALHQLDNYEMAIREIVSEKKCPRWDPLWPRIYQISEDWPLSIQPFLELLDGARFDLKGEEIDTMEDLIHYSNLVAGSVGSMMLPFLVSVKLKVWDEIQFIELCHELDQPSRDLGIAMQITNILRDVGEDLRNLNRIYLPKDIMYQFNITRANLEQDVVNANYISLLESLMEEAEVRYMTGLKQSRNLRLVVRPGIRSAAKMYREIMNEIRRNNYNNHSKRAFTSKGTKFKLVFGDRYLERKKWLKRVSKGV